MFCSAQELKKGNVIVFHAQKGCQDVEIDVSINDK